MTDYHTLANAVGENHRALEASLAANDVAAAKVNAATGHDLLNQVYVAVNEILDAAGMDRLDWSGVSGAAQRAGGAHTNSGGGPKGEPGTS